jgi:hypothetical protein
MGPDTLAHEELQALIGRALTEPDFCKALLNGGRDACLDAFALTREEREVARAIEADDLQAYAHRLNAWIQYRRRLPRVTRLSPRPAEPTAVAA